MNFAQRNFCGDVIGGARTTPDLNEKATHQKSFLILLFTPKSLLLFNHNTSLRRIQIIVSFGFVHHQVICFEPNIARFSNYDPGPFIYTLIARKIPADIVAAAGTVIIQAAIIVKK